MYELIKKYESFRSKPYLCPAGIATIGFGSTFYEGGTPVKLTDNSITQERASELLEWYCENKIKLPQGKFTQDQEQALKSLIYNIGQGAFDKSTLKKAIEVKDWGTAFKNWDWINGGGKPLNGLIKRRAEEMHLFFKDI